MSRGRRNQYNVLVSAGGMFRMQGAFGVDEMNCAGSDLDIVSGHVDCVWSCHCELRFRNSGDGLLLQQVT